MKEYKKLIKLIVGTSFLVTAIILLIIINQIKTQFADTSFSEIIFHLKVPLQGANTGIISIVLKKCITRVPIIALICLLPAIKSNSIYRLVISIGKKHIYIPLNFWEKLYPIITIIILSVSVLYGMVVLDVPDYILSNLKSSKIYETYYVDPSKAKITFPKEKRNLIYIFMESMENSYMSTAEGGIKSSNLIPELTNLQLSNTNFAINGKINGAISTVNTGYTMGAIVAQTAGIPLSIPIEGNSMNLFQYFLPGAYSIGNILEKQGYQQVFLLGSDAVFGGRKNYMTQHGNYRIEDYYYAIENKWIDPDYKVWWGYEDKKLYSFAKRELKRISESNQPFNLTMLTVDTHFVGGYLCGLCENKYPDQYSNVIACSSKQIADFVSWIQKQPFYKNTTIVISGDHPTMDTEYMSDVPNNYQRKVYTTIINSACDNHATYDRTYTTMDLYPTTLASLGAVIKGDRLGLGTNLYSNTHTLVEEMGIEKLNNQLSLNSKYYNSKILYK